MAPTSQVPSPEGTERRGDADQQGSDHLTVAEESHNWPLDGEVAGPPCVLYGPRVPETPFLFDSPHSGRFYPRHFLAAAQIPLPDLRKSEDAYVDELFSFVTNSGALFLKACFPRAYVDVNREPYELDPRLFRDPLPPYANSSSPRSRAGLGTIARVVSEQEEIYARPLPLAEGLARIDRCYHPYHHMLQKALRRIVDRFGYAILIDCHSMPSHPLLEGYRRRPDFVLGDRFATACHPALTRFVENRLRAMGYDVTCNLPYAGGYIAEHYGKPSRGIHVLQIEINRALYLDEVHMAKTPGFGRLRQHLKHLVEAMIRELPMRLAPRNRYAAE